MCTNRNLLPCHGQIRFLLTLGLFIMSQIFFIILLFFRVFFLARRLQQPTRVDRAGSLLINDLPAYHLHVGQIASGLGTHVKHGIHSKEVDERRLQYGNNTIDPAKRKSVALMLLQHLFNSITFILYFVFIITSVNSEWIDAGVVMFIIIGNAALGFIQELKSENSIASLQRLNVGAATVIRDGTSMNISINDVVVGDLVMLKQGDNIPADMRVIEAINLEIDEALLTGESVPVFKNPEPIPLPPVDASGLKVGIAIGDRNNMAFRQTIVASGTGAGIVVAVGYQTKVGQLTSRLQTRNDDQTPLQRRMSIFMYILFAIAIILAFVIFGITGWTFDKDTAVYACATGIALLPEALIAVVTVTLALAVNRMSDRKAMIRKMAAVEILGNVTDICSDKTGTLTEGKMVVKRVWPGGDAPIFHVTGGPLDATAGFGTEVEDIATIAQSSPTALTRQLSARSAAAAAAAAAGTSTSHGDVIDGRVGALSIENSSRRLRAPSYQHTVPKVVQGEQQADYGQVQAACSELAMICAMCNNTNLQLDEEDDKLVGTGNPTEIALQVFSFKIGRSPFYWADMGYVKCGQWAFDSKVKCMSQGLVRDIKVADLPVVNEGDEAHADADESKSPHTKREALILCKGAPEAILPKCVGVDIDLVMSKVDHLAKQGYRVLAAAVGTHLDLADEDGKRLHDYERSEVERNLRFVGLAVVFDPPRAESYEAVKQCKEAGITFRMVTGDHHATGESIARRLKILEDHDGSDRVITGPVLDAMTDEQIDALPELPLVIARCSPESKVRMILALHRRKRIVAMTGDGMNDAPAIKIADVGACMGIAGVDVTKGAADMILADDNIATLVHAVEEGRHVSASIRKFVVHLVTSNIAEVIILMIGLAFRDRDDQVVFPMTALEILWVNMLTSTPPAIGISLDPMDPENMRQPPDERPLFCAELIVDSFVFGIIMGALAFGSYLLVIFEFGNGDFGRFCNERSRGMEYCSLVWRARSTAFLTLNQLLLLQGYICRDLRRSTFTIPIFNNLFLLFSFVIGTVLALGTVYIPALAQTLFKHAPITWEWAIIAVACVAYLILTDVYKLIKRYYYDSKVTRRNVVTEDGGRIELVTVGSKYRA